MKKHLFPVIGFVLLFVGMVFTHCGSDEASTNALSRAMGLVAVTSPTASSSRRSSGTVLFSGPDAVKPMNQMITDMQAIRDGDPATHAAALGNPMGIVDATNALCYGPTLDSENSTGTDAQRPTGDLGLFYEDASDTDTTACAAAQLNALMGGSPQFANKFIGMQGVLLATANAAGNALPGIDDPAIAVTMPSFEGITVTAATLDRLADDADGNEVYKTIITFTDANSAGGTVTIYHTPLNADNSNFKGLFQAILPHVSQGGPRVNGYRGISMVYQQLNGVMTFSLKIAANRGAASNDFFGTNGTIDFTKTAFGEDGNWLLATFNTTTNAATAHYAWQAGDGDGAVRTFSVDAQVGTEDNGGAYFGYGADIDAIAASGVPWITKMYCNWTGVDTRSSEEVAQTKAQKQTFSLTDFTAVVSNINFAPTDSCSCDGAAVGAQNDCNPSFAISAGGQTPSFMVGVRTVNPHNLVAPPTTAEIPAVTEPTYTLPTR